MTPTGPAPATAFEALAGRGASARVDGRTIAVGGPRMLGELGLASTPESEGWANEGRTVLHVVVDGRVLGALGMEDEVRPESAEAVLDHMRSGCESPCSPSVISPEPIPRNDGFIVSGLPHDAPR